MKDSKVHGEHRDEGSGRAPGRVIAPDFRSGRRRAAFELPPEVGDSLAILDEACGDNLVAVIFFGSRLLGTSPNAHSAADLFVVVDEYKRFYQDIGRRLPAARRASIMAALNHVLPPNIILIKNPGDLQAGTKCFVIRRPHLEESLVGRSRDHFCRGRMMQRCQIIYARSAADREELERWLQITRERTLDWVPSYLGERFTVFDYCLRMLEVSYAGEIRPESRSRVREVFDAQRHFFRLTYGGILERAVEQSRLVRVQGAYRLGITPGTLQRIRWRLFFAKSRARAVARWFKYTLTFDDWVDYIARKAERRTGIRIELTPAERRFPLLLLWPKAIQVFRAMRAPAPEERPSDDGRGGPRQ